MASQTNVGVTVRTYDYGGVSAVGYLDDGHILGMWNTTIAILTQLGWTVGSFFCHCCCAMIVLTFLSYAGKDLRAAPYDWRFGPETFVDRDWPRLKTLIEETFTMNNNTRGNCFVFHLP